MAVAKNPMYKLDNGTEIPATAIGVFNSEPEKAAAGVRSALVDGYRLVDTAASYMNERQVGEGVRSSGISREQVFITTKLWISDYGYDQTFHAFERSLRKLELDVLDLADLTKGTNVTVNAVLPEPTRSEGMVDFLKGLAGDPEAPAEQLEAEFFIKGWPSSLPQRMIEPQKVASLVAYAASPLSPATNGAALRVDGGVTPPVA